MGSYSVSEDVAKRQQPHIQHNNNIIMWLLAICLIFSCSEVHAKDFWMSTGEVDCTSDVDHATKPVAKGAEKTCESTLTEWSRCTKEGSWGTDTQCYATRKCVVYGNVCTVKISVRADGQKIGKKVSYPGKTYSYEQAGKVLGKEVLLKHEQSYTSSDAKEPELAATEEELEHDDDDVEIEVDVVIDDEIYDQLSGKRM